MNYAQVFQPYLEPGESVVWAGRPYDGFVFRAQDIFITIFFLIWGGIPGSMLFLGVFKGGETWFAIVPVFFVSIALYFLVGRYFVDMRRRAATTYALTENRALILSGFFSPRLVSIPLANAEVEVYPGRRTTIKFGEALALPRRRGAQGGEMVGFLSNRAFELVEDGERVYKLILKIQREGATA